MLKAPHSGAFFYDVVLKTCITSKNRCDFVFLILYIPDKAHK
jgi:hypothetical protein